jgi:hypothetical protein
MPKSKRKSSTRVRLSQDALFFLHKVFGPVDARSKLVDLKGKYLGPRAIEASCELIEMGFLHVDIDEQLYQTIKAFPDPPLKLQRIREAYEAFELFVPLNTPEEQKKELEAVNALSLLIEVIGHVAEIQTDLLSALRHKDTHDPVAQLHVLHAIQGIVRLSTEGVKGLETVLE